MIAVLTFHGDGTGRCLYTEAIPLQTLGTLQVRRASTIEFNQASQQWEVKDTTGRLLFSSASRAICMAWEHDQFNRP